jgi:hypothetical protein
MLPGEASTKRSPNLGFRREIRYALGRAMSVGHLRAQPWTRSSMSRRNLLVSSGALLLGCGGARPLPAAPVADERRKPATAVLPAAGLDTVTLVNVRALLAEGDLLPRLLQLFSSMHPLAAIAKRAGVDLQGLEHVTLARYAQSHVAAFEGVLPQEALETAFTRALGQPEARSIDQEQGPRITRIFGQASGPEEERRQSLVLTGRHLAVLEAGSKLSVARAVSAFCAGKIKRAEAITKDATLTALRTALRGSQPEAPVVYLARGPFWGLRGALGQVSGFGVAVTPSVASLGALPKRARPGALELTLRVAAVFDQATPSEQDLLQKHAEERTLAIAGSNIGHLCGLHQAIEVPVFKCSATALTGQAVYSADAFLAGLEDATSTNVREMMQRPID